MKYTKLTKNHVASRGVRSGWIASAASAAALALGLSMLAPHASAQTAGASDARGILMPSDALTEGLRTSLVEQIATARAADPLAFAAVSEQVEHVDDLDRLRRGRYIPFSRSFRALGERGVLPLIELVAFKGPSRESMSDIAWDSMRASALQALGETQDPRARPIIESVLRGSETNAHVLRNAAAALGAYEDDAAAATLIELAAANTSRSEAIIAGMGECHRAPIATFLASQVTRRPQEQAAKDLFEALSDVGNAWAWKTARVQVHASEQMAVRTTAMHALLDAMVNYDGYLRGQARKALFVVNHPETVQRLEALKAQHATDAALLKELDRAIRMILDNPID